MEYLVNTSIERIMVIKIPIIKDSLWFNLQPNRESHWHCFFLEMCCKIIIIRNLKFILKIITKVKQKLNEWWIQKWQMLYGIWLFLSNKKSNNCASYMYQVDINCWNKIINGMLLWLIKNDAFKTIWSRYNMYPHFCIVAHLQ